MTETHAGWKLLLPPTARFARRGAYPIAAYSEFMPPPRLGWRAYSGLEPLPLLPDDPWGWQVSEYEEALELAPGLTHLAAELLHSLVRLGRREGGHNIGKLKLLGNPYWPEPLAGAGAPPHERYVVLLALALSRTQDDKGRVRWTLFGASEQGPARPFWRGFFTAPGSEAPAAGGLAFCRHLVELVDAGQTAAGGAATAAGSGNGGAEEGGDADADAVATRRLLAAGFRILPVGGPWAETWADEGPLPSWTAPFLLAEDAPVAAVRHLLTFRPFAHLPPAVRQAYLDGRLHLLPFPGSLLFWGAAPYHTLAAELPLAAQIPLLHPVARSEDPHRLRVPQSGWLHEPHPDHPEADTRHGPLRNTFRRSHRWQRVERTEDELAVAGSEDRTAHVLFSAGANDIGLYGKPMARNAQLWTHDYRLLLDGPRAGRGELAAAAARLAAGGTFGYRFLYPAMRVGEHEVYWHRILAALPAVLPAADRPAASASAPPAASPGDAATPTAPAAPPTSRAAVTPAMIDGAPLGYLTAYNAERPDRTHPLELWPRLLDRPADRATAYALGGARAAGVPPAEAALDRRRINNVRKLLDAERLLGGVPLPASFAQALLRLPQGSTLAGWLDDLVSHFPPEVAAAARAAVAPDEKPAAAGPPDVGPAAVALAVTGAAGATTAAGAVRATRRVTAAPRPAPPPLTFHHTARRRFEEAYWRRIAFLAEGRFVNKDNADCVRDPQTQKLLRHAERDLDALAEYLIAHYDRLIADQGMAGRAIAGDLPFRWQTDFDFGWSGGWLGNQDGNLEERNVVLVIPGRDRGQAVIMADHYDTAYMEDRYGYQHGGHGPRLAAAGADDNHSATAALMLAAPLLLEMSRAGTLACDVWLVHLTGEEFPSDCMGARHLTQALVEGTLRVRQRRHPGAAAAGGEPIWTDLSAARVRGVYVLDMVAHNNDRRRDVFQMCPGAGSPSMWLALQAHLANRAWNEQAPRWNRRGRAGCHRGRRSADGKTMPAKALHPLLHGEVRPQIDPHSTLYNTDGQIFSDAGVPVVLFMENYDINRHGYHDSHDTMENIDLDYGAAVAAIAIESVARAATEAPPRFA